MNDRFKFKAQRQSGEWVYFTLNDLVDDSRLRAEWQNLKNVCILIGVEDKNDYENSDLLTTYYPVEQLPENKAKEFLEKVKSIKNNM